MAREATRRTLGSMRDFLQLESAGGILLIGATAFALVMANIPAALKAYDWFLGLQLTITIGGLGVDKPLLLWINDALMVLFFMLVGLELKREVVEGELSRPDQVVLPVIAAIGGLVLPAAIFWYINGDFGAQKNGWAIPTATDIAFALAMLTLMGSRVPVSLKIFLTTIAIVDDLLAIIIIALFYTSDLSVISLALAGLGIIALVVLNRMKVMRLAPYMLVGLFIWLCVLKSGVHATLAGVVVAAFIPLRAGEEKSPARLLEHSLHPWVAFAVLPIFAFANAGVPFQGMSLEKLSNGVPMGIILGLVVGKQVGIFGMILLARLLLGGLFIVMGYYKFGDIALVTEFLATEGLPASGALAWIAAEVLSLPVIWVWGAILVDHVFRAAFLLVTFRRERWLVPRKV